MCDLISSRASLLLPRAGCGREALQAAPIPCGARRDLALESAPVPVVPAQNTTVSWGPPWIAMSRCSNRNRETMHTYMLRVIQGPSFRFDVISLIFVVDQDSWLPLTKSILTSRICTKRTLSCSSSGRICTKRTLLLRLEEFGRREHFLLRRTSYLFFVFWIAICIKASESESARRFIRLKWDIFHTSR